MHLKGQDASLVAASGSSRMPTLESDNKHELYFVLTWALRPVASYGSPVAPYGCPVHFLPAPALMPTPEFDNKQQVHLALTRALPALWPPKGTRVPSCCLLAISA